VWACSQTLRSQLATLIANWSALEAISLPDGLPSAKGLRMRRSIGIVAGCLAVALLALPPLISWAGPTVSLGRKVLEADRVAVGKIDHSEWNTLLTKYVDNKGNVDYAQWKLSAGDQKLLDSYIADLSGASFPADATRNQKLAFWINAYNAVTVKGILREYPTTSIRNHTAKLYGYNIWKDLKLVVGDRSYSLEAIEHEVLRKMGEPRIHFAIVCASIGCPQLLNEAYLPARIDEQMTRNATAFFADPAKFRADPQAGTVQVSPILSWFASDFGADDATRLKFIAPFVPASARALVASGRARLSYLDYDWGLNDRSKLSPPSPQ